MAKQHIKYLVLEDSYFIHAEIVKYVSIACPDMQLAGVAEGITDALEIISNEDIDLVIADIEICDGNTVSMFEEYDLKYPLILYSEYNEIREPHTHLNLVDYLLKPVKYEDLKQALIHFEEYHFNMR